MKKISLLFVSVIIFTGMVFLQTQANAADEADASNATTEANANSETNESDEASKTDDANATPEAAEKTVSVKTFVSDSKIFISSRVKIELKKSDNVETGTIFYQINNGEETEYSEPFAIEEEGTHTITYYSVDKLENREASKVLTVVVDNTPPTAVVNIRAPFVKNEEMIYASEFFTYNYSLNVSDSSSGVEFLRYSIGDENASQKQYIRPFSISSTAPSKINVFSEDKVGNATTDYTTNIYDENGTLIATSTEEIVITVDNTPPEVTVAPDKDFFMKDDTQVANRNYKYTIAAVDEEAGVKSIFYRLDNSIDFVLYTGQEITFTTNGKHKIEAIAVDNVGNTSAGTILEFFVDDIASSTELNFVTE